MGYGKKLRGYARNASAYTLGYIYGGHAGGFAAYKGAKYIDNSLQKMGKRKSVFKPRPKGKSNKWIKKPTLKRKGDVMLKDGGRKRRKIANPRTGGGDKLEISGHNDMVFHKFSIWLRKASKRGLHVGRYAYQETWDGLSVTEEGKQYSKVCKMFMTAQQLLGSVLAANRLETESWGCDPCALNPYSTITNTGIYPSGQTANDAFYLESIRAQLSVVSTCTIPQKIKIMWLMYKVNSNQTPTAVWDSSINYEAMGQASIVYPSNPTIGLTAGGQAPKEFVEQSPFMFKNFRKHFKLLHQEQFVLQPGDQRQYEAFIQVNKRFDIPYIRTIKNATGDQYLGGITVVPMIIHYGGLVQIQKAGTLDTTYGIADIGIMQNNRYTFRAVKADRISTNKTFVGHVSAVTADLDPISTTTTREFTVNVVDAAAANISI